MTIVHTNPSRKRPQKAAQPVDIQVPRLVQHTPKGRALKPLELDPAADGRVAAFLKRMIRPRDAIDG
jgi:hypothetical protein